MPVSPNEALKKALEAIAAAKKEKERAAEFMHSVGPAIVESLQPALEEQTRIMRDGFKDISNSIADLTITVPEVKIASDAVKVTIPEIKVPEANIKIDNSGMSEAIAKGFASIKQGIIKVPKPEVTVNNPPFPKIPDLKWPTEEMPIKGWVQLMGVGIDNPLPVQLRDAKGRPVNLFENLTQVVSSGGGLASKIVKVSGITNSALADYINSDNRLRVSVETGGSGLTDAELRAASVPVEQVSGSRWSTEATQSGNWNINTVTTVTGVTNSVAAALTDSTGVQYSGSNPLPISGSVTLSGALTSSVVVGPTVVDAADDGNAPVQVGGVARTANPTAVAANDIVKATFDDVGRQIVRPVQVRDLIQTAYTTLTTGTETTFFAGVASTFFDLVYIAGANNSDAAVSVDIRSGTANGVVLTLQIPANGTTGVSLSVPIPQDVAANTWTADMADITGTTVSLSALFSKEV